MVEEALATAPAGGRLWHHTCDASFIDMQIITVVGSRKLPLRFQRKAWEVRQGAPERAVHEFVEAESAVETL